MSKLSGLAEEIPALLCYGCGRELEGEDFEVCTCWPEVGAHVEAAWCSTPCLESTHRYEASAADPYEEGKLGR